MDKRCILISIKITENITSRRTELRSGLAKLQDIQCIINEAHKLRGFMNGRTAIYQTADLHSIAERRVGIPHIICVRSK